jgi:hypothetical protein
MLESLLQPYENTSDALDDTIYTCYFLQALYWSLGAGLTEQSRIIFDAQVKYLASMNSVDEGPDGTAKLGTAKIAIIFRFLFEYSRGITDTSGNFI